jgi:hypothetical protein
MIFSFACILQALAELTTRSVGVTFTDAVRSQVSELMRHQVSETIIAHIAVAVDEHASAGQVREHGAGISGWHVEAKGSGRVNVPPVRHKENSQRINVGLHDPNLSGCTQQSNCVAITRLCLLLRWPR